MSRHSVRGSRRRSLLASLSGASVALLAGSDAEAGIIVTTVNQDFSVANGNSTTTFDLPGVSDFIVNPNTSQAVHFINVATAAKPGGYFRIKGSTTSGKSSFHILNHFNAGVKWGSAAGGAQSVGGISIAGSFGTHFGRGTFTNKYFLFEFKDTSIAGDPLRYGWIEGSLSDNSFSNMTYHLTAYAYDDTGAQIAAGDTGAVPEPSAAALGGIGAALVMGAAGVRRWKRSAGSAEAGAAR